ncbi:ribosome maturation factor RimP [Thiotrichales bacterium 19S9-12]|nr:ribosome maturation factor RimP [Thiotrichales bacterium 19S9-11]MCF6810970.1 ribosome maturation factor RimP [Thiotrichales bacterium 19S9-12]
MQLVENLDQHLRQSIEQMDYILWGIELLPMKEDLLVRIYIDHPEGISVDDCQAVSTQISGILDVENIIDRHYTLEVSSPGADRILFTLEQVKCFEGFLVKGKLKEAVEGFKKFKKALLKEVSGNTLVIEIDQKLIEIDYDQIEQLRISPQW